MKVEMEHLGPLKRALSIEVESERVAPKLEEAYRQMGQKAAVPGFRKGKIPKSVLELHFRREVEDRVIREIIPEAYAEAMGQSKLRAVGSPEVDRISLQADRSLHFRAMVEVKPDLEIKEYLGIQVLKKPVEVDEEEVEQALQVLQENASQFIPMEGWPALEGDLLYVDLEGWSNKKLLRDLSRENFPLIPGSHTLFPDLEAAFLGMQRDEVKELEVAVPSDFVKRDLAGRKVFFRLRVREIKKKKVPELNDEFPKEIGEEGTLQDLREKVKKELLAEKGRDRDNTLKEEILEKIRESTSFELPPTLVEEELAHLAENARRSLSARRATLKDLDLDEQGLRERLRSQAEKRVGNSLILEAIAEREGIEPTEEEIEKEIGELSAALRQESAALRRYFEEKDGLAQIKSVIRERKAMALLFEKADLVSGDRIVLA